MEIVKLWPVFVGIVALMVAIVKLIYQVQKSLDWQKEVAPRFTAVEAAVGKLSSVPDRLGALERGQSSLERKVDRFTTRTREIDRLREDLNSVDNDLSGVRDAILTNRKLRPRTPRHSRTPASGVPIALPNERTESNDDEEG